MRFVFFYFYILLNDYDLFYGYNLYVLRDIILFYLFVIVFFIKDKV